MKAATGLAFLLLALAGETVLADDAAPTGAPTPLAPTEITLDKANQFLGGIGFGGPLGAQGTIGLLKGLGADVQEHEDNTRVRAVCAVPIPHCARGFLLEVGAGSGGGRASLGVGARARVEDEDFHGVAGAALKLTVARTWGSPIGTDPNLTYLGPELGLEVKHVGLDLGVLFRVSGEGGSSAVFSWGLGFRL